MPLESVAQLMHNAQQKVYAVGYFESWSLESLQGVIDAAEETRSPIIVGFSGEFLSRRVGADERELELYAALGRAAAEQARVPCGLIFNECARDAWVERAITVGFNLVMLADPDATHEDYTRRVARLTNIAHARKVAIEAELDELPQGNHDGAQSDPQGAADFAAATGIDLLAVSVGNEHIKLTGRAALDLSRLEAIAQRAAIPLVLHGGSGIEDDSLKSAIRLGVRKINYGTYIKQRYREAMREALSSAENNPHAVLGGGSETDVMVRGRRVVKEAVLERIELLGCCGKA